MIKIAKRASDVKTQTKLKQTNWNGGWFRRFLYGQKPLFLKHFWNENFAYIPCISLRTRLCWLSLAGNSVICILFLDRRALRYYAEQRHKLNQCFVVVSWISPQASIVKLIDNNFHSFKLPFFAITLMTKLVTVGGHAVLSSDVWRNRLYNGSFHSGSASSCTNSVSFSYHVILDRFIQSRAHVYGRYQS